MDNTKSAQISETHEKYVALALAVGSNMLKNGGETYRAEECVRHILMSVGAEEIEIFAIPTSVIISAKIDGVLYSRISTIKERDVDLNMIDRINTVCRQVYAGKMTVDEANEYLKPQKHQTNRYLLALYSAISSAAFVLTFGGTLKDFCLGFFAAIITNFSLKFFKKTTGHTFLSALCGSFVMAALSKLSCIIFTDANFASIIIGGIMPMLPGLAITNAVRDTMNGDLVSGSAKAIEAVLQAVAIAVGVSVVLMF